MTYERFETRDKGEIKGGAQENENFAQKGDSGIRRGNSHRIGVREFQYQENKMHRERNRKKKRPSSEKTGVPRSVKYAGSVRTMDFRDLGSPRRKEVNRKLYLKKKRKKSGNSRPGLTVPHRAGRSTQNQRDGSGRGQT